MKEKEEDDKKIINDLYEEDDDTYVDYHIFFIHTHSKCPVCGTLGYHNGFCIICDFPDYEENDLI